MKRRKRSFKAAVQIKERFHTLGHTHKKPGFLS